MNTNFSNSVFGTLPKQYCIWFYILCVISFLIILSALIGFIFLLTKKNVHYSTYLTTLAFLVNYCLIYLTYRLLYSMCISSLK